MRAWLVIVVATAVAIALPSGLATADDLDDQKAKVEAQLKQTKQQLNESSAQLQNAVAAVEQAQVAVEAAQAKLAKTEAELAEAKRVDQQMAAKLKESQAALKAAKAAVEAGQLKLDQKEAQAAAVVRQQVQQKTNLMPIALLVGSNSLSDLQTRAQWSHTMIETSNARIIELTDAQRDLNAARVKQTDIEKEDQVHRKAAAANLVLKRELEAKAQSEADEVASLLNAKQAAESAASDQLAADKQQYQQQVAERESVEKRIAERIAREKAEAARKAAAARAARIAAEKRKKAAEARARAEREEAERAERNSDSNNNDDNDDKPKKKKPKKKKKSSNSSASHGFDYPVDAPITSPYGMRFHPVLHYWKLHDGTDFGAGCGSAIRAPYKGRVEERYFNSGYGNRLIIDHGEVDGRYVTTAYNHAIRYTVGVGERVEQGEVIGYVGSTGYSTGCHLHLMVWLDGDMKNPMSWF
ncbi:peptidoglycan DD-metalloendopeptidase family protein [Microlunatus sp. GCM10028923]|uniref:peptidoglycan DD-metalloendopeptidase family protein n=1 Tax=Microlunatus sp. GCM10028923 TaxID=3273400 RepID=UPI0036200679